MHIRTLMAFAAFALSITSYSQYDSLPVVPSKPSVLSKWFVGAHISNLGTVPILKVRDESYRATYEDRRGGERPMPGMSVGGFALWQFKQKWLLGFGLNYKREATYYERDASYWDLQALGDSAAYPEVYAVSRFQSVEVPVSVNWVLGNRPRFKFIQSFGVNLGYIFDNKLDTFKIDNYRTLPDSITMEGSWSRSLSPGVRLAPTYGIGVQFIGWDRVYFEYQMQGSIDPFPILMEEAYSERLFTWSARISVFFRLGPGEG